MTPANMVPTLRITTIFDESQSKYKCCCGCMTVRTGTAIIATLKMFGVLMAILELFTGPHFAPNTDMGISYLKTTTIDPFLDPPSQGEENAGLSVASTNDGNNGFAAVRFASTVIYLLVEAVAVSCLFYALRRERPKFVIPEMALILVCMSLELVVAILVIIAASFGSESLVQMVVNRMRAQGTEVTSGDVDQIRRLIPFVLTAFAFALIVGAAIEFWFFRVLKAYYRYLRDKMAFRTYSGGDMAEIQQQHCYVNGYQPMMEESVGDERPPKDMPPAYQEVVQQEPTQPPSYKDFEPTAGQK